MMPELFDVIELTMDIPERELYAGMQGTIVEHHGGDAYEVEFTDESGETLALLALRSDQFIVVWRASTGAPISVAEQVAALIEALPQSAGQEILDFARFLHERRQRSQARRVTDPTRTA
jgi:hypothetical protein